MNYATNFAIVENGIVTNIAWGMIYSQDDIPNAIQIDDRNVQVGDVYLDGVFYHDGQPVRTVGEEYAEALSALSEIEEALHA